METQELRDKVLEFLNVSKETSFSDDELCQMLKKKRANHHSDKTIDDDLKEDFDKKFIELDRLYKDFTKAKVKENQSAEIVLVSKDLDYFETKQENIELEETIEDLKQENQKQEKIILDLNNSIKIVSRDSILKERESLINAIKPQKKDYFKTLGIIASLTLGLNILTKFENISNVLRESFSVNANYILISLFSIICILFLYNLMREYIISNISLSICTAKFTRDFREYHEHEKRKYYEERKYYENKKNNYAEGKEFREYYYEPEYKEYLDEFNFYSKCYQRLHEGFSESSVLNYITLNFKLKRRFLNLLYKYILNIYNDATLETLKQIFILELLNKKFIRLGAVYEFEQQYIIIRQQVEKAENGEVYLKEY